MEVFWLRLIVSDLRSEWLDRFIVNNGSAKLSTAWMTNFHDITYTAALDSLIFMTERPLLFYIPPHTRHFRQFCTWLTAAVSGSWPLT